MQNSTSSYGINGPTPHYPNHRKWQLKAYFFPKKEIEILYGFAFFLTQIKYTTLRVQKVFINSFK
jgi:hypothetical protein